mmetsp:Transcript_24723/g.78185  ORF Transcript_24723/g.78185 Transcript_24723/m.78185 type:complete len:228 (-) Transcript_24723:110-793(-)
MGENSIPCPAITKHAVETRWGVLMAWFPKADNNDIRDTGGEPSEVYKEKLELASNFYEMFSARKDEEAMRAEDRTLERADANAVANEMRDAALAPGRGRDGKASRRGGRSTPVSRTPFREAATDHGQVTGGSEDDARRESGSSSGGYVPLIGILPHPSLRNVVRTLDGSPHGDRSWQKPLGQIRMLIQQRLKLGQSQANLSAQVHGVNGATLLEREASPGIRPATRR